MDIGKDLQKAYDEGYADGKADTVRKMQERLSAHFVEHNEVKYGGGLVNKIIDQIAEEIINGSD